VSFSIIIESFKSKTPNSRDFVNHSSSCAEKVQCHVLIKQYIIQVITELRIDVSILRIQDSPGHNLYATPADAKSAMHSSERCLRLASL